MVLETIRKKKLSYGTPFEAMQGNVAAVDYEQSRQNISLKLIYKYAEIRAGSKHFPNFA